MNRQIFLFFSHLIENFIICCSRQQQSQRVVPSDLIHLTPADKEAFVIYLLKGQQPNQWEGPALRHVNSTRIKDDNLQNGCEGDAVSYSITNHIINLVFHEENKSDYADDYYWIFKGERIYLGIRHQHEIKSIELDQALAIKIFDCLHNRMLQFIDNCRSGDEHHFMFIYHMGHAPTPYDCDIFPTGKCGRRRIEPTQFTDVFSKDATLNSAEKMLHYIETGILRLAKGAEPLHRRERRDATTCYGRLFNPSIKVPSRASVHPEPSVVSTPG